MAPIDRPRTHAVVRVTDADDEHPVEQADAPVVAEVLADRPWWPTHLVLALAMPLVMFLVLRPEPYGITPNGLDPFFYTGYTINFDDIMREIGGRHYFVSRWTAYMPGRPFTWMFGPSPGRLVLRWLVASEMLLALWHLGRRWRWRIPTEIVIAVVFLGSPMFARAFMTDYVEWFVVAGGTIFVCQCLEPTAHTTRTAGLGALAASIAIANPAALAITVAPSIAYLVHACPSWRSRLWHSGVGLAAGALVVLIGLLAFKHFYDVSNVYAPTVDFLRERSGTRDLLKSPRLSWMAAFTWIYTPAILLGTVLVVRPLRHAVGRLEVGQTVLVLLAVQYLMHWLDQFVRDGNGLEISYYWSFVYPAFAAAVAMVIGTVGWTWRSAAAVILTWCALLAVQRVDSLDLPAGWVFLVLCTLVVGMLALTWDRYAVSCAAGLMVLMLTAQIFAPPYDPTAYHRFNMSPQYDAIFFNSDNVATKIFEQTLWFERQLDTVEDAGIFLFGAADASVIIALYGVQVTGKQIRPDPVGRFPQQAVDAAVVGTTPIIGLYAQTDVVDDAIQRLSTAAGGRVRLRAIDPIDPVYELAVIEIPPAEQV